LARVRELVAQFERMERRPSLACESAVPVRRASGNNRNKTTTSV
jgi:hypothetical protein